MFDRPSGRRRRIVAALGVAAIVATGIPAAQAATSGASDSVDITLMSTTDLHAHIYNWDYYTNAADSGRGLARISSLVSKVRADKGRDHTLLFDSGDTIQGTPLGTYFAKTEPITSGGVHPMAAAMNAIGYDAMAVGNHEFNYGIENLRAFQSQLDFPMLGANVHDAVTDGPAFTPYIVKTMNIAGHDPIRVGILGLTTPGSAIWDKSNVEGKLKFNGIVEEAKVQVPRLRAEGVDLVVVAIHSGTSSGSSYGNQIPFAENASTTLAQEVPGIDVILAGHSHSEIPQQITKNKQTGKDVLLLMAGCWGKVLGVVDLNLTKAAGGEWAVNTKSSKLMQASTVADDPAILALTANSHQKVLNYVNGVIGTSLAAMPMREATYKDVPALDFVNYVQGEVVKKGIAGTEYANLPVLSIAAPFDTKANIPKGDVTVRDMAGVYIYDNTLIAVKLNGAQLKDFLEWSAGYMKTVTSGGPFNPSNVGGNGPAYNYDVVRGLGYDIDISKTAGQRITNLTFQGQPLSPTQEFVVVTNNYRQNGGGNAPHVPTAEIVYNPLTEVRDEIINWVQENKLIDPTHFASVDWRLVYKGAPVLVLDTVPTLTPSATSVSFGFTKLGTQSPEQTVTFTNTSQSALTLSSVQAPAGYTVTGSTCTGSLAKGASCTVTLVFAPTASQPYPGNLVVTSSATNSPTSVALAGTGSIFDGVVITSEITGGALTMATSGNSVTLNPMVLNGRDQITTGSLLPVEVIDPRGTGAGWSLTGQVSDFVSAGGIILADNFGWDPFASVQAGSLPVPAGTSSVVTSGGSAWPGHGLGDAKALCSAAAGASAGAFTCAASLQLGVPASALAGVYTGVLTLTLV